MVLWQRPLHLTRCMFILAYHHLCIIETAPEEPGMREHCRYMPSQLHYLLPFHAFSMRQSVSASRDTV